MPKAKNKSAGKPKSSSTKPGQTAKSKILSQPTASKKLSRFSIKKSAPVKHKSLSPAYKIFIKSLDILRRNWAIFVWILIIYAIVDIVVVHGLSLGTSISSIKSSFKGSFSGVGGKLLSATTVFVYLIGDSTTANGSNTAGSGVFQTILIIVTTLAIIWALRQLYNSVSIRARDAFYKGMYPIIQFFLVLLLIAVELLPFLIGAVIFATVTTGGISSSGLEDFFWGLLFILLATTSLYLICSSLVALYIVTLPEMTPMKAIRSARALVKSRRWLVIRKILFLPLALFIVTGLIMMPFLLGLTVIAGWVFFVLSVIVIAVMNSYMYALYRELIA